MPGAYLTKSQPVNIAPTKTIKIRSHLSGSLFISQTPLKPPRMPPNPRANTAPQLIEGENIKMMTADCQREDCELVADRYCVSNESGSTIGWTCRACNRCWGVTHHRSYERTTYSKDGRPSHPKASPPTVTEYGRIAANDCPCDADKVVDPIHAYPVATHKS